LVPIRPLTPSGQESQNAANRWADPWVESDPWKQAPQSNPPQGVVHQQPPAAGTNGAGLGSPPPSSTPAHAQTNAAGPFMAGSMPSSHSFNTMGTPHSGTHPPASTTPVDQPPWLPLLLVSLSLVGSLSANLFLGWSYIDARQKYHMLVRKTADTFRRAAKNVA
jgi:hypothetical protein